MVERAATGKIKPVLVVVKTNKLDSSHARRF